MLKISNIYIYMCVCIMEMIFKMQMKRLEIVYCFCANKKCHFLFLLQLTLSRYQPTPLVQYQRLVSVSVVFFSWIMCFAE